MVTHELDEFTSQHRRPVRPDPSSRIEEPRRDDARPRSDPHNALPATAGISELQRSAGNRAITTLVNLEGRRGHSTASPKAIQRQAVNKKGVIKNWGGTDDGSVTVNPNAAVSIDKGMSHPEWFIDKPVGVVEVDAGASGTVTIRVPWYWHHHGIVQELGRLYGTNEKHIHVGGGPVDFWVATTFTVTPDGKVTFSSPAPQGTLGAAGYLDGSAAVTPKDGDGLGSITVSLTFRAVQTTTVTDTGTRTTTGTATGGITGTAAPGGIGGSATAGGSYGVSEASAHAVGMTLSGSGAVTCSFGINLKVKEPPKKELRKTILYDKEGKWKSGNDGIRGVQEWWHSIPASVREAIIAGKKPVRISGRASATGTYEQNELVVKRRIRDVEERLKNQAQGMVIIADSEDTSFDERSVVIRVLYTENEAKPSTPTR